MYSSHFLYLSSFLNFFPLVHEFLELEGPTLLNMRIKHLIKVDSADKAAVLAKLCSEYSGYEGKGNFKQTYLLCVCMTKSQEQLMEEVRIDTQAPFPQLYSKREYCAIVYCVKAMKVILGGFVVLPVNWQREVVPGAMQRKDLEQYCVI